MKYTVYTHFLKRSDSKKKKEIKNRNKRQAIHITSDSIAGIMVSCHRWMFCHVTLKHFDSPVCEAKQYEQLPGALKINPLQLPC